MAPQTNSAKSQGGLESARAAIARMIKIRVAVAKAWRCPVGCRRSTANPRARVPHIPGAARSVVDALAQEPAEAEACEQRNDDERRPGGIAHERGEPGVGKSRQKTLDQAESPTDRAPRSVIQVIGDAFDTKILRHKREDRDGQH